MAMYAECHVYVCEEWKSSGSLYSSAWNQGTEKAGKDYTNASRAAVLYEIDIICRKYRSHLSKKNVRIVENVRVLAGPSEADQLSRIAHNSTT